MIAHFKAVKDRLLSDSALAAKGVHDTALLDTAGDPVHGTYVILYGGTPDSLNDYRLTSPQQADSDAEYTFTIRAVSVTGDGVRAVGQKVVAQLVGYRPTIAGRTCSPMTLEYSSGVIADTSVTPPLFYADIDVLLKSSRA